MPSNDLREAKVEKRFIERLREHFGIHTCRVLVRPLGNATPAPRKPSPLSYRLLSTSEIHDCMRDPQLDMTEAFVRAAARRSDACVGAFDGETLAGYAWLAFAAAPYREGVWVTFDPRACYAYKVFVRPAYREQDIEGTLRVVADDLCIWAGKTFSISFIESGNRRSIEDAQRAGAHTVARAAYMAPTGMNWALREPGVEPIEFRFFKPGGEPLQSPVDGGDNRMEPSA
jgi:hypothetical protein